MSNFFESVSNIKFEGKDSKNPLAFKYYNAEEKVGDKTMEEITRFAMSYWHTFAAAGEDIFGAGTYTRPWEAKASNAMELAKMRVEASFEFMQKLGMKYFCFHDVDIAPDAESLKEAFKNLDEIVPLIKDKMDETGIKLLWGTSNLFSHPRFVHGASTSPNADVFAYSAARVKKAMEITKELGGSNYVFWGGREGYESLLNTDMGLEQDNLARFLQMAVDYAKEI
ncbi:MAG: xylose isomerase, partial [Bacillota bacterium]